MKRTRRHFSSNFKTRVVLEALKERESTHQLAEKYELHPNQISSWKKEFLENADKAFGEAKSGKDNQQERIDELYRQVGQIVIFPKSWPFESRENSLHSNYEKVTI